MNHVSTALAEHAVLSPSSSAPAPRAPEPGRRWPRSLAALEVRNYRLYLSSQMLATTGLWMQRIAQDWLVLELTHSVTAVGIAVALQFLPVLLFGLVGGLVVDRFPKRVLLIITQTATALTAATLGVLALTGAVQAWHVYVVATALGLITVVDNPTRQVFVSELVGSRHIRNAISLNSSVFQLGALVGPAASGALIHAVGQGWSFLLNALSCLVVVVMVCVIRTRPTATAVPTRGSGQLKEGLRAVARTSEIGWTIALVGTIGVFGLNMPVILAAFADHVFRLGVGGYSLFSSATAVGALSGAIVSARRTGTVRLRSLVAALTLLGVAVMAAALSPDRWVFVALLAVVGFCTLTFLTGANSLVQTTAGPAVRGRVMSIYLLVLLGGQSLGGPAVGWLIDHVGARPSMFVCGGLVAIMATLTGLAMARRSHLTLRWRTDGRRLPVHIVHG
ncbi:MAG: putative major facilitator superfamily transporter [Friedmanniella sp.]|nr:putative major facilitator superfamily transporter [Friedmanniella sp.]